MFEEILRLIAELRPQRHQRQRETFDNHVFKGDRQEECAEMPGEMAG